MSLFVSQELVDLATEMIDDGPVSEANAMRLEDMFVASIQESLPEYYQCYTKEVDLSSLDQESLGRVYRGLASEAMQQSMTNAFGFKVVRHGNTLFKVIDEDPLGLVDEESVQTLSAFPKGFALVKAVLNEATSGNLQEGVIWAPAPGSPEEPDAETHFELLAVVSDIAFRKYLAQRGLDFIFSNCCSGFTGAGLNSTGKKKKKRFGSVAMQVVRQVPERQAFCC